VPFTINVKHEARETSGTSWINSIELILYGNTYKILKGDRFLVNGIAYTTPYSDSFAVNVVVGPEDLIKLTTNFGLEINFIDEHDMRIVLSEKYKNYVCGMCGNYDGKCAFYLINFFIFELFRLSQS
jgi:hypothetical protein